MSGQSDGNFPFTGKKYILGITKGQMVVVYLLGVVVYILCSLVFTSTLTRLWGSMAWRDFLTLATLVLTWVIMAIYNHFHPDEEIHLNLTGEAPDRRDKS